MEDWPDRYTLHLAGVRSPYGLLGFYHSISLALRAVAFNLVAPDRISVCQSPIEAQCTSEDEVKALVRRGAAARSRAFRRTECAIAADPSSVGPGPTWAHRVGRHHYCARLVLPLREAYLALDTWTRWPFSFVNFNNQGPVSHPVRAMGLLAPESVRELPIPLLEAG